MGQPILTVRMGLRPTNRDESPVRGPRLFNELRWAFDRAAAFQAAFGRAGKRARGQDCPPHFYALAPKPHEQRAAEYDSVPSKAVERVRAHESQEPANHQERGDRSRNKSECNVDGAASLYLAMSPCA